MARDVICEENPRCEGTAGIPPATYRVDNLRDEHAEHSEKQECRGDCQTLESPVLEFKIAEIVTVPCSLPSFHDPALPFW